ncbi:MAG: BACON domain-containing protein [Candidatus Aminicenantes bacterium]|jgi:hypothetical protein
MSRGKYSQILLLIVGLIFFSGIIFAQQVIIDHTCTDITKIPDTWINKVKSMLKVHYAHTSHGEQITEGLERLSSANSKYGYSSGECNMPQTTQKLSLMDGQYFDYYCETYISPGLYWEGSFGLNITRGVLNRYDVNVSLWAWCSQLDDYNQSETQAYLNAMSQLEAEYPDFTFVYLTGNAQGAEQNRYNRNNQIRNYCRNNNKFLFDFADLDCWYNGQQYTEGGIPMEHPHYHGDQAGHTTYESCENKAKAFWWLLARIAGWDGSGGTATSPVISLNKNQLTFNFCASGPPPSSQTFTISNAGSGTLNWTVSENMGWLTCTPTSGTDSGTITVSIDNTGLAAGPYATAITVSSSNASNSPQYITVYLNISDCVDEPPFGSFDTPIDGSTVKSSIAVTGWALDESGVDNVKIYRGPEDNLVYIGDAVFVEGARPDVETAFPDYPNNAKAGWGYMMLTNFLPNGGNGTFTIHAIATDITGNQVILGTKTIYCDNANAVKPFGAIDSPTQGGTASGSSFINWGWVLTPQSNYIPTDGSTIKVYVDGVNLGHPTYNIYRSDIAALFPGYANSNGAAGYFHLDTKAYENGVHTIQWTATDNQGNTDGIGSRYFTIQNSGSSVFAQSLGNNELTGIPVDYSYNKSIRIKYGCDENKAPENILPDDKGVVSIKIKELERVEIHLEGTSDYTGHQVVGNQLKRLPIGSFLDAKQGIFCWTPGPGFVGVYELVFINRSKKRLQRVNINILPKYPLHPER